MPSLHVFLFNEGVNYDYIRTHHCTLHSSKLSSKRSGTLEAKINYGCGFAYIRFPHRGEIIATVLDSTLFALLLTSVHEIRINLPSKKERKGKRKIQTISGIIYGKLSLVGAPIRAATCRRHLCVGIEPNYLRRPAQFIIIRMSKRNKQMKFNLESSFEIILHCFTFIKYHL